VEIAKMMGSTVMLHDGGRSAQKNWGAKFANGEYLYFVDSDFILDPNVISSCLEAIEDADGVVIRNQDITKSSKVSQLIASRRRIMSYDPLNVAIRFVRKEAFDRLGGFDSDLIAGEDLDLHRRFLLSGFKMEYSQAREWHLGSPAKWKDFLNGNLYYSPNVVRSTSKSPLLSLKRINPLRTVSAWKKSDNRSSDLLLVVFFGFFSIVTLLIGVLLNLRALEGRARTTRA
jgi:glycosyltransferase involved in cell wall biosynthesis